jgi:ABC-type glycerol-3-phosphate transport system substrate-binding protein
VIPEIQRVNAISRGYAPTRSALYKDRKVLQVNPLFGPLRNVLAAGAAVRPSTAAGPQYEKLSTLYFTAVRKALLGEKTADDAVRELEEQLPKVSFLGDNRPPDQSLVERRRSTTFFAIESNPDHGECSRVSQ